MEKEEIYGCNLINTKSDRRQLTDFVSKYHMHILLLHGTMSFSDGKNTFTSRPGDLAIWQMSNTIQVNALQKESVEAFAQKAAMLGPLMYFIDTAGASPNQAKPEHIVDLDMVGTGYAIDAFGEVMAEGGAGLIISSQAADMYPIPGDIELQLVNTPTEQLKDVKFIREVAMKDSGLAYMIAKRVNHLQAQRAAATSWCKRRARINTISPGVIVTPLAYDEFRASGEGYQAMIDASSARRTGTSDEIAEAAAFLLGEHARFITGTDLLIDGGVIASIRTGGFKLWR